jgi:hypothetical protein
MSSKKVRIVAIQGTMELLHALSILYFGKENTQNDCYQDYLVLHGTGLKDEILEKMFLAVSEMAKCWEWKAVINASNLGNMLPEGPVHKLIGIERADVILCVRNWQPSNIVLLSSFSSANVIAYGDSFGFYDCYEGDGHRKIDEAHMLLPIQWGTNSLRDIPITIISKDAVISIIDKCINHSKTIREFSASLAERYNSDKVLVLLSNFYECGLMDFQDEVNANIAVIRKHVTKQDAIFIKPHPRQSIGLAIAIKDGLKKNGFNEIYILKDELLSKFPIEIYCRMLTFKKTLTMLSTAAISLYYLFDIRPVTGFEPTDYGKVKHESTYQQSILSMNKIIDTMLPVWDRQSILYSTELVNPCRQEDIFGIDDRCKEIADGIMNNILNHYEEKKIVLFGATNVSRYMLQNINFEKKVEFIIDSFKSGIINGKKICAREELKNIDNFILIINVVKHAEKVMDILYQENLLYSNPKLIRFDQELNSSY